MPLALITGSTSEIRTPLNAIIGMAHLIRRKGISPSQEEMLDKLEIAGQHLLEVISAILDLSKIEAGKFELEETVIDLSILIGNVASMLRETLAAKRLTLWTELPELDYGLRGDATRLQQALLNFANNAVKFTEEGGVTLRVSLDDDDGSSVLLRFEVIDTGIGISSEVQERLFSPFEQADNSLTRNYGGTGLGLVITRRLAELMGGQAGMSSVEGGGSNFWFTARLKKGSVVAQASEYRECAEEAIRQRHAGKRILLAEDEPINQEITYTLLVDVGLEVDCADDGELALEKAQQRSYALVLMDVQMPVLDGLRATQKIRQLPSYQKTPILAMTANAFTDDKDRCFDAGMDDFMTKPVMPEIFYAMLLKWLERRLH